MNLIQRLQDARSAAESERQSILAVVESQGRHQLDEDETLRFQTLTQTVKEIDARVEELESEHRRAGRHDRTVNRVRQIAGNRDYDENAGGDASRQWWGRRAATELRGKLGGNEARAIVSGSVDVPSLVLPMVTPLPFPQRVIDLLVDRQTIDSMVYVFYQQSQRINEAWPVPDLGVKPVSTMTVQEVQDRCRVVAHLSEPLPYRIWTDYQAISDWLANQMGEGVLAAIEEQVVAGDGQGEDMLGILNHSGTTHVTFTTDLPTTLRHAQTVMQNLGEKANGWVLNPADAEAFDLIRWGTGGGLLTGGFESANSGQQYGSADNVFGATARRVISPSVPAGTALLADWNQIRLFIREQTTILVNAFGMGTMANNGTTPGEVVNLFSQNAIQLRAEARVGFGILRPQAFAVVALHS